MRLWIKATAGAIFVSRTGRYRLSAPMRELLLESFHAAVGAADPLRILAPHLPAPPRGRTFVAAAGKAAASMALAVEKSYRGDLEGIAITRYGHGLPTRKIRVVEAGHPVPDEAGEAATREVLQKTKSLREEDLLLALLSGGGSSLLSLPAEGISMADLKALTSKRRQRSLRKETSNPSFSATPSPGRRPRLRKCLLLSLGRCSVTAHRFAVR